MAIPTVTNFDTSRIPVEGSPTFRADASYVWSTIPTVIDSMNAAIAEQNNVSADITTKHDEVVAKEALMNPHYTAIDTVNTNISAVETVSSNITNVNAVGGSISDVNAVAPKITDVSTVAGSITNVNAIVNDLTNIDNVAGDLINIDNVANDLTSIATNAANIDSINTNAQNITAIQNASNNALIAQSAANYRGDWSSTYNGGNGYALADSVTYTDGYSYVSKIGGNTVEPTSKTNTAEWNFIEAVSPDDLALKADKATTLSGYGITDAYTKNEVDTSLSLKEDANVNITKAGNTFNGANQLVQLDTAGKLPAVDGSQLTGIASFKPLFDKGLFGGN